MKKVKRNIKKKKQDYNYYKIIVGIFFLVAIFLFLIFNDKENPDYIVVTVNGEAITQTEMLQLKSILEQQTGQTITEDILIEQVIIQELLIQEVNLKGLMVSLEDAEETLSNLLFSQNMTLEILKDNMNEQEADYEEIIYYYQLQLGIFKLSELVSENITITQEEVQDFYDVNIATDTQNAEIPPFEDIEADITTHLLNLKKRDAFNEFIISLREDATIIIS